MQTECAGCGADFEAKRKTARYCSPSCQKRGKRSSDAAAGGPKVHEAFVAATVAELERIGKQDTVMGRQVVIIAERMVSHFSTGTEVSNLSKEHSRLMGLLSRGAAAADPVDELRNRRDRKTRQASG